VRIGRSHDQKTGKESQSINQRQEKLGLIEFLNPKVQVETVGFCAHAPLVLSGISPQSRLADRPHDIIAYPPRKVQGSQLATTGELFACGNLQSYLRPL
jgi:hypothetical protein